MKIEIRSLFIMFLTVALLTSCLKDYDETGGEGYSDSAIISFSLGILKQKRDTLSKRGTDSTYTAKIKGDKFKFYIDQNNSIIYNPDSLPYGTKTDHALTIIKAKNAGSIMWKSLKSDSTKYYSSKDSVDLRQSRILRVRAQNRTGYRDYTVKVNVHKQKPEVFVWMTLGSNADLASLTATKAIVCGDNVFVFGQNGGQTVGYKTSISDGRTWTALPVTFTSDAYKSAIIQGKTVYISDNGTVKYSSDGNTWQTSGTNADLVRLVASSTKELYGLSTHGGLMVSKDNGVTWTDEQLDDSKTLIPSDNIAYTYRPITTNDSIDRVLLAGSATGQDKLVVWTKLADYSKKAFNYAWAYVDIADNHYALPILTGLSMATYDNGIIALGMKDGKMIEPMISRDGGISWRKAKAHTVPADAANFTTFTSTVDSSNFIWIIGNGKVWRGRLNRLGWTSPQKSFER